MIRGRACQSVIGRVSLLDVMGTFQPKTRGYVAVEVSPVANKLNRSNNYKKTDRPRCQIPCWREYVFREETDLHPTR